MPFTKITVDVSLCGSVPRPSRVATDTIDPDVTTAILKPDVSVAPPEFAATDPTTLCTSFSTSEVNALILSTSPTTCLGNHEKVNTSLSTIRKTTFPPIPSTFRNSNDLMHSIPTPTNCPMSRSSERGETYLPAQQSQAALIEPPPWAVRARGDARLEPVCETPQSQSPVDLTVRDFFRIGRSPTSDVQLLHSTSSRRHALLFHHPNGSCYVVDCGSAHGTFVNGIRVQSTSAADSPPGSNMVVPHRVRRGALLRFGGTGAPSFVLKSFSVGLDSLARDLGEEQGLTENLLPANRGCPSSADVLALSPKQLIPDWHSNHKNICQSAPAHISDTALVLLNTRLNALGGAGSLCPSKRRLARRASARFGARCKLPTPGLHNIELPQKRNRYVEETKFIYDKGAPLPLFKKIRTCAPEVSGSNDFSFGVALISPVRSFKPALSFEMFDFAMVSPNPLDIENSSSFLLSKSDFDLTSTVSSDSMTTVSSVKSILSTPRLSHRHCSMRRVTFSECGPEFFFPPSVTPDAYSDTEVDTVMTCSPRTPRTAPAMVIY